MDLMDLLRKRMRRSPISWPDFDEAAEASLGSVLPPQAPLGQLRFGASLPHQRSRWSASPNHFDPTSPRRLHPNRGGVTRTSPSVYSAALVIAEPGLMVKRVDRRSYIVTRARVSCLSVSARFSSSNDSRLCYVGR
eukprot:807905-Amphidinium_carterae.3